MEVDGEFGGNTDISDGKSFFLESIPFIYRPR